MSRGRKAQQDQGEAPGSLPKRGTRWVPLSDLHEDPANVRKHGDRNRAAVRASLAEFGQVEPLVVEKGTGRVLGGNCRLGELRALGQTEALVLEVDTHGVDATRLALALNQTAILAEWDPDGLERLIRDLKAEGLEVPGFDDEALTELLDDAAEEVPGLDDEGSDYEQKYAVLVQCDGETHQQQTFERLAGLGYTCKVLAL